MTREIWEIGGPRAPLRAHRLGHALAILATARARPRLLPLCKLRSAPHQVARTREPLAASTPSCLRASHHLLSPTTQASLSCFASAFPITHPTAGPPYWVLALVPFSSSCLSSSKQPKIPRPIDQDVVNCIVTLADYTSLFAAFQAMKVAHAWSSRLKDVPVPF